MIIAFCLLFTGIQNSVKAQSGTKSRERTERTKSTERAESFEVYAHRGFRGLNPENTIGGMKNALRTGAILEFDLNITRDKQVIVCHDGVVNPKITLGPGGAPLKMDRNQMAFYQMNYDQVRGYDVGSKANPDFPQQMRFKAHIPLFAALIDSLETYAAQQNLPAPRYFIETKLNEKMDGVNHPGPGEFVNLMMQIVKQKGIQKRMIVQSFDPRTLQVLRKKYPQIQLAFLAKAGTSQDDNLKWLGFNPEYYSANAEYIDEALVAQCARLNIRLITGNCNDYQQILRIAKLGVKRVITDYPMEWLSKRPPE
ncbi:MAG: glycerophosphodiester phosphodiesterase family protein [Bacteroidota bacterium]